MLVVVMTLGEVLFNSRAVGRLGSLLFFFFGSLSYVPFFASKLQFERLFKRSPINGTIFRRSFRIAVKLGYVVSGDLSQSATFRQRDRDTTPRPGFSRDPLPRGGGEASGGTRCYRNNDGPAKRICPTPRLWRLQLIQAEMFENRKSRCLRYRCPYNRPKKTKSLQSLLPLLYDRSFFRAPFFGFTADANSAVFIAAAAILGLLLILCPQRLQMLALAVTARIDRNASDALFEHRKR